MTSSLSRLKGLFDAGFLNRIEAPQKKDIYRLGRRSVALLLSNGLITDDEAERRSREHELAPATLEHEMMIADTHVIIEQACMGTPLQLVTWREGEIIRDTFEVSGYTSQTVTIQPDVVFELLDTRLPVERNRCTFFLEADRSTMPIQARPGSRRFRDKIDRYRFFIEHGRPQVYGAQRFRIVTLTQTPARRDNLCADTEAFLIENNLARLQKFFLFGSLQDVSLAAPAAILDFIFRRPGDSMSKRLCRTLAETSSRD